jgi:hypothetical protein
MFKSVQKLICDKLSAHRERRIVTPTPSQRPARSSATTPGPASVYVLQSSGHLQRDKPAGKAGILERRRADGKKGSHRNRSSSVRPVELGQCRSASRTAVLVNYRAPIQHESQKVHEKPQERKRSQRRDHAIPPASPSASVSPPSGRPSRCLRYAPALVRSTAEPVGGRHVWDRSVRDTPCEITEDAAWLNCVQRTPASSGRRQQRRS